MPIVRAVVSVRASTALLAPTTIAIACPLGSRVTACCGTRIAFSRTPSSTTARTYMFGSSTPSGFGNSARSVIAPVDASTVTSENCSTPSVEYGVPSSSCSVTRAASLLARLSSPLAIARRRRSTSLLDCVTSTYIGFICWIVASGVGWLAVTSAPAVTVDLPTLPEMGATTLV